MNKVLTVVIAITFLLAVFNWYEEGHYLGFVFANFGAVFGAAFSAAVYALIAKKEWLPKLPFAIATLVTTGFSALAYIFYVLNGQAENTSESASQMHIILVPILLATLGVASFFIVLLAA